MEFSVVAICVPLGIDGNQAVLDVLITPSCDGQAQIQQFMGWADFVLANKDGFWLMRKVPNGPNAPVSKLRLATENIRPKLWRALFSDTIATVSGIDPQPTPIASGGVSMTTSHELAHNFLSKAHNRPIDADRHAPSHDWLKGLHAAAISDHGVFESRRMAGAVQLPGAPPSNTTLISRALDQHGGDAASHAAHITKARFGVSVGLGGGAAINATALRVTDKAKEALAHIQLHTANSFNKASKKASIPVPPGVSAPRHFLPHVNRLIAAATEGDALSASNVSTLGQPVYTFNQRITMLLNTPTILEALGLVLRFRFDAASIPPPCEIELSGPSLDAFVVPDPRSPGHNQKLTAQVRRTCTNVAFLPRPKSPPDGSALAIGENGWLVPTGDYGMGCLQLESAAMLITQFSTQAGLRQSSAGTGDLPVTVSHDEDVDHSILPPSTTTGGLQVWHTGLQDKVIQHQANASTLASQPDMPLFAEDLRNGIVVDIQATSPGNKPQSEWLPLCKMDEEYHIDHITFGAKNLERSVKTSSIRVSDPSTSAVLSHEVDETLFVWRDGSLVAKSRGSTERDDGKRTLSTSLPWAHMSGGTRTPVVANLPPPRYDWSYLVALRAGFVTGSSVAFDPDKATASALTPTPLLPPLPGAVPPAPGPFHFLRYELLQGPVAIPVANNKFAENESPNLQFVASKVDAQLRVRTDGGPSVRLLVPAQVNEGVAQRHNMDPDKIKVGAATLTLPDGGLPDVITEDSGYSEDDDRDHRYLPDPMVQGVIAVLTDLNGKTIKQSDPLLFFQSEADWPNYAPHLIEVHAGTAPDLDFGAMPDRPAALPMIKPHVSQKLVCSIPPGTTYLLHLYPSFWPSKDRLHIGQHAVPLTAVGIPEALLPFSDLCRPTVLRLTHATERPCTKPVLQTSPQFAPATTTISIDPGSEFKLGVQVNAQGVSKASIHATWSEYTDDIRQSGYTNNSIAAQLASYQISKRNKLGSTDTDPGLVAPEKVQFPFNDGRHRKLTVLASAVSRYGSIVTKGDDDQHTTNGDLLTVHVNASKPPLVPDVEYVLPNLRWQKTKDGRKRTSGLTVVLNRPWFTSGEGEQLAILTTLVDSPAAKPVQTITTSFQNPREENTVSAWGIMQDWFPTPQPGVAQQKITISEDTDRDETAGKAPSAKGLPKEGIVKVGSQFFSALFFMPRYNQLDGQWYVNLSLSSPPVYGAVVRLVVARYQANAAPENQLSPVTLCDFSVLRPERSIVITERGFLWRKKHVQIFGVGTPTTSNQQKSPQNVFDVGYFNMNGVAAEFNYEQVEEVTGKRASPNSQQLLWEGGFSSPLRGGKLVVQEREIWRSADGPEGGHESIHVFSDILSI